MAGPIPGTSVHSAASAFAASLGVAAAPAAALSSLAPELRALSASSNVFRSALILDGSGHPAPAAAAGVGVSHPLSTRPASQQSLAASAAPDPATAAAAYPGAAYDMSAASRFAAKTWPMSFSSCARS